MKNSLSVVIILLFTLPVFGSESSITEADGIACMGREKSRIQTEEAAMIDAKRMAAEFSATHISSSTIVENFQVKEDIIKAFTQAEVKMLSVLSQSWDSCPSDCYQVRIRAEVIPLAIPIAEEDWLDNPGLPLKVRLWVNSEDNQYRAGQRLKVYLQGNKPFYARLVYVTADGSRIQLLPNQHRTDNYFPGAQILEVPSAEDRFNLDVSPPYGAEQLILYASTLPLGIVESEPAGEDLLSLSQDVKTVGMMSRGITIAAKSDAAEGEENTVAEFAETTLEIVTRQ